MTVLIAVAAALVLAPPSQGPVSRAPVAEPRVYRPWCNNHNRAHALSNDIVFYNPWYYQCLTCRVVQPGGGCNARMKPDWESGCEGNSGYLHNYVRLK